ncbi:MAG: hypothetical protein R3D45_05695 [Rhizobiaceae bacterium]
MGTSVALAGCVSTARTTATSVSSVEPASRAQIIDALAGGLFGAIDDGQAGRADRMLALEAEYRALEHTPAGQTVPWRSERSALSGEVTAAQPYRVGSQDCRPYAHKVNRGGETRTARGTACRNADGSWTPLT